MKNSNKQFYGTNYYNKSFGRCTKLIILFNDDYVKERARDNIELKIKPNLTDLLFSLEPFILSLEVTM